MREFLFTTVNTAHVNFHFLTRQLGACLAWSHGEHILRYYDLHLLSNYGNKCSITTFVRKNSVEVSCILFNCLPKNGLYFTFCPCSPQNEGASFHFDGSGYSVVEKMLRATVTQIIMLFSTFSPNGLLLYLASNGTVRVCGALHPTVCIQLDCYEDIYVWWLFYEHMLG